MNDSSTRSILCYYGKCSFDEIKVGMLVDTGNPVSAVSMSLTTYTILQSTEAYKFNLNYSQSVNLCLQELLLSCKERKKIYDSSILSIFLEVYMFC